MRKLININVNLEYESIYFFFKTFEMNWENLKDLSNNFSFIKYYFDLKLKKIKGLIGILLLKYFDYVVKFRSQF